MVENKKKSIIEQYLLAGYNLVELDGKIPMVKKWTTTMQNVSSDTNYNVGVVLTETDLVIDIDPRSFDANENVMEKLARLFENSKIDTFKVKTGGGGWHIYLKKPSEVNTRYTVNGWKGIEFATKGRQVVIPGSIHPDTKKEYKISDGSIFNVAEAPLKLLELLALPVEDKLKETTDPKDFVYDDSDENVARFEAYLLHAPVAVEGEGGNNNTYKIASMGKDFGLSALATLKAMWVEWNLKCLPPWCYEELWELVCNAYKYTKTEQKYFTTKLLDGLDVSKTFMWSLNKFNEFKPKLINIVNILDGYDTNLTNLFRFNLLSKQIEMQRVPPWKDELDLKNYAVRDSDIVELRHYLSSKHKNFEPPSALVFDAVQFIARRYAYHPVLNYLNSLTWDGVSRLDTWLKEYAGVEENAYTREIAKKTIVAAVKRIFEPGCKFDNILVLEGAQGVRKSTLCNILGGKWFADLSLDLKSKDAVEMLQGKWIIEISEMEVTKKADAQSLKAFLSRCVDRIRLPYGRFSEDFPRQNIFIGTINPTGAGYLKDATGNRRFWIVKTNGVIKTDELSKIRNQLFAEAVVEYRKGCETYLESKEALAIAEVETYKRQISDPFFNAIKQFIENDKKLENKVCVEDLALGALALGIQNISPLIQDRIATVLIQLGYSKQVDYKGNIYYTKIGW
jgi:hypothetical protein